MLCAVIPILVVQVAAGPAQVPGGAIEAAVPCASPAGPAAAVVRSICQANATWDKGNLEMDPAIIAGILDEQFVWVTTKGLQSKADVVDIIRTTTVRFARYESEDVSVWVTRDMAFAVGLSRRQARQGASTDPETYRFTRIFVRRGDKWLIVSHSYFLVPKSAL